MLSILCRRSCGGGGCFHTCLSSVSQSVSLSRGRGVWPFPWCLGPHCTGPRSPQPQLQWSLPSPSPPSPASLASDIWWSSLRTPVQTCSLDDPLGLTSGGGYWSSYGWCKGVLCILLECLLVLINKIEPTQQKQCKICLLFSFTSLDVLNRLLMLEQIFRKLCSEKMQYPVANIRISTSQKIFSTGIFVRKANN